ncbi:peptidase inhibitor family I36 protein [Streptomyces fagopyri]|uniref:peptidase inhibitor family I36 protein n=1 Tax=Streptomyces fagopyri TaxID=2662397 RepID=UPI0036BE8002
MGFWRKSSAAFLASVALATGGAVATAAPASAAQACPAGNVCLYASTGFNNMGLRTVKTNECFQLASYHLIDGDGIMSYRNNLSVKATLWHTSPRDLEWVPDGTINAGGFSSNTSGNFSEAVLVCTGSRSPYWSEA